MSLAAITQNKTVVVPYKFVKDKGAAKTTEIYNSIRQESRNGTIYYCANCFWANGSLLEVVFRGTDAEKRRPHFAHTAQSSGQCVGSSPESEKHSTAKVMVADWLRSRGASVTVEYRLNKNKEGRQRQPDVFAEFPDRVEAHEIQLARINGGQITERTDDILRQLAHEFPGKLAIVYWYLAPQNQRPDNWGCFDFDRRHGYAIDFDEDTGAPEWRSYEPEFNAEIRRQQAIEAAKKRQRIERERQSAREAADRAERQKRYKEQARQELGAPPSPVGPPPTPKTTTPTHQHSTNAEYALAVDGAWFEAHREAMESAPPRPHPFDFGSWAEFLEADDQWKARLKEMPLESV